MKISTTFLIPVFDMIPVFDVSISEYTADIIYMDQSKKKKRKNGAIFEMVILFPDDVTQ